MLKDDTAYRPSWNSPVTFHLLLTFSTFIRRLFGGSGPIPYSSLKRGQTCFTLDVNGWTGDPFISGVGGERTGQSTFCYTQGSLPTLSPGITPEGARETTPQVGHIQSKHLFFFLKFSFFEINIFIYLNALITKVDCSWVSVM